MPLELRMFAPYDYFLAPLMLPLSSPPKYPKATREHFIVLFLLLRRSSTILGIIASISTPFTGILEPANSVCSAQALQSGSQLSSQGN